MMLRSTKTAFFLLSSLGALLVASPAFAGWEGNVNYGGGMSTDFYTPDNPSDSMGIIVSLHYCGGTKGNAQQWFSGAAAQYGFMIITPQAGGNCFDATAAKGGERGEIVAMVEYAVTQYGADPERVFAAGASSGACMAHALAAAYPDVFAGGSALAGVAAGVWTGGNAYGWSVDGSKSDEDWGNLVRDLNPGYTGPWPRMQIYHGEGDTNLTFSQNFPVEKGQWANVWGIETSTTESIQPPGAQETWNRESFVDACGTVGVEANSASVSGDGHDLTGHGLWNDVVRFFGLDGPGGPRPNCGGTTTTGTGAGGATATTTTATDTTSTTGGPITTTGTSVGGATSTTGAPIGSTTGAATQTSGVGGMGTTATAAAGTAGPTATSTTAGPATAAATTGGLPPENGASEPESGCSCRLPSGGNGMPAGLALLGLAGLGVAVGRRRSR